MRRVGFLSHPVYLEHNPGSHHPEAPARLQAIEGRLVRSGLIDELTRLAPRDIKEDDAVRLIEAVHKPGYTEAIRRLAPQAGIRRIDPDTAMSPGSYRAAVAAVAGAVTSVDEVMEGRLDRVFCAIRPPGHHATPGGAMGFCLFNNVAIAARYAQQRQGARRVLILDWDVHHGNGTQDAFYEDPSVMYISLHQFPLYPGTGREEEVGAGPGTGYTLNCPLPEGRGDDDYIAVFHQKVLPAVQAFAPDLILISAGFDAHQNDPLAGMAVTEEGFGEMTRLIAEAADRACRGRIVSCLEGGYHLPALAASVERHLEMLR